MRALPVNFDSCPGSASHDRHIVSGISAEIGTSSSGRSGRWRHPRVGRRAVDAASATTTIAVNASGAKMLSPLRRRACTEGTT